MKTKYIFGTLALAAFMAACSNEDFEQAQNSAQQPDEALLAGRAVGEVTLNVSRNDMGLESRVEGAISGNAGSSSINWRWSGPTDKLGGVVVNYAKGGEIVDLESYPNYVITNYPFAPGIDAPAAAADFSCPSAVVEGAYIFYSQYDGQNTDRRVISHEISRVQTVKDGTDAGLKQIGSNKEEGGQNFFISPIVEVAVEDGSDIATPLSLTSAHAVLNIVVNSDLEDKYYGENGLQINKIVVQTTSGENEFKLQNTIDPAALQKIQKAVYDENPTAAWRVAFNPDTYAIDGDSPYAREAQGAVLAYLTNTQLAVPAIGTQATDMVSNDLVYQLETPYTFKKKGDKMDLYVIMPTGTYTYNTNLPAYNGKTDGALRVTIYTSEGTYDRYLGNDALTAHRNQKINLKETLKIKGDETNINLYDPNKGFDIESTADYEFTIDYIKNHFRDFGNASDWKAPILNFVDGVEIDVNEGYYFPDFRVEYKGKAVLNLTEENKAYSFNPKNVILDAENTPTINVVEETSSITFDEAVPCEGGTQAVELISAGPVNVNKNVVFSALTSSKEMTVADDVKVEVLDENAIIDGELNMGAASELEASENLTTEGNIDLAAEAKLIVGVDFKTKGNVTLGDESAITVSENYMSGEGETVLNEKAVMTVAGEFDNSADITINATALVELKGASTNDAEIDVKGQGQLKSGKTFTNENGAVITVEDYAVQGMDDDSRGIASFATLTNETGAVINIREGSDNKGTYGGLVEVSTKLTNNGVINVNGELMSAKNTVNAGTIKLQENAYARIVLEGTATLTDKNGNGSVVLEKPEVYEMFDSFFTGRNKLGDAEGVIEAEMDQATYNKVMENWAKYDADQETAWEVLNKITVKGALEVKSNLTEGKDFVLSTDASLVATTAALTINSLTAKGTATALSKVSTLNSAVVTINKDMNVLEGAEFGVAASVKTILKANAKNVLNIAGKFTNSGAVNAAGAMAAINTTVASTGELINLGTLGSKTKNATYFTSEEIAIVNKINADYYDFVNIWYVYSDEDLNATSGYDNVEKEGRTFDLFVAWYISALDSKDSFVYGNKVYKVFTTNSSPKKQPIKDAKVQSALEANNNLQYTTAGGTGLIYKTTSVKKTDYTRDGEGMEKTYGSIQDYIAIETNYGVVDLTAENSKAYGYINENEGTKKGEFTEDYKNVEM